ncbi:hypothetical protein BDZ94DRAFT_1270854 [Collybia nuda]|uniref:Uncharacterized protein n=1 Tax=Collybia nuda TaxID=64659 RepID=A0A9P5XVJ4_9AGAR|nr:hypothetical protein BDZ94DRAFT_1270854 [Collybia nuda]
MLVWYSAAHCPGISLPLTMTLCPCKMQHEVFPLAFLPLCLLQLLGLILSIDFLI